MEAGAKERVEAGAKDVGAKERVEAAAMEAGAKERVEAGAEEARHSGVMERQAVGCRVVAEGTAGWAAPSVEPAEPFDTPSCSTRTITPSGQGNSESTSPAIECTLFGRS